MSDWLERLADLPPALLYLTLALAAAVENVFPPFPADTVVAFGAFIAARAGRSVVAPFLASWAGNLVGAAAMYALGRRFGTEWLRARLARFGGERAEARVREMYGRRGMGALFLSRFLPGVRAVVPPLAGAMRLPALPALASMSLASGIWYGLTAYVASHVGARWEDVTARLGEVGRVVTIAAVALAAAIVIWVLWRRRRTAS